MKGKSIWLTPRPDPNYKILILPPLTNPPSFPIAAQQQGSDDGPAKRSHDPEIYGDGESPLVVPERDVAVGFRQEDDENVDVDKGERSRLEIRQGTCVPRHIG